VTQKLIIKPQAELDVASYHLYLLTQNRTAAARFRQAVKDAYREIRRHPRSFATVGVEGFEDLELRFCHPSGFSNHFIVFQVTDDGTFVLRVLQSGQDLEYALRGG
jgi:plasmid stabilization system protein ParE